MSEEKDCLCGFGTDDPCMEAAAEGSEFCEDCTLWCDGELVH